MTRTNTKPRRAVLHTKAHSMIFSYTDTVSVQAVTLPETCINICLATYRICPCLSRVQILIQSHLQIANWFCPRKFGILNLACHNVNRWFTANGIIPVKPASPNSLFFFCFVLFFLCHFLKLNFFLLLCI